MDIKKGEKMFVDFYDEVKKITKDLVSCESVVKGGNESQCAKLVYDFYNKLAYFRENPEDLVFQQTKRDEYIRHSTLCILRGKKPSKKTIVLMGHIDTVGVDDFGKIKDYAFNPDELPEKLKEFKLDQEVLDDIESGDYMFGRGSLDMKAGVAGHMAIIRYFSENLDKLEGNIVSIAECDEEDGSHGIITALDLLGQWKDKYGLDYQVAINADYSTPYYPGDKNRYIYLGTIGKVLPSFYILGKETHVGQAFSGLDPNLIAAELTRRVNLNTELCDTAKGETTVPPVSLRQKDTKETYTVQTPLAAEVYYNFFIHGMSLSEITSKMKKIGQESFDAVLTYLNKEYEKWCNMAGHEYTRLPWKTRVYTWEEFIGILEEEHGTEVVRAIEEYASKKNQEEPNMDMRDFSRELIQEMYSRFYSKKDPLIILYYGSVYSQNIEIEGKNEREANLIRSLEKSIEEVQLNCKEKIEIKYFYPYISDSSFMYITEDDRDLNALKNNTPSWGRKYYHPVEAIRKINMPVVNIGTYGKDGHKMTERVHMDFTFQKIPNITLKTIFEILKNK